MKWQVDEKKVDEKKVDEVVNWCNSELMKLQQVDAKAIYKQQWHKLQVNVMAS